MRLVLAVLALALPSAALAQPQPASANAKLYADCLAESARVATYDRSAGYLRFSCYGPTAQAFYEALEGWSGPKGWERNVEGRNYRYTAPVKPDDDGNGIDRCWRAQAGNPEYGCLLIFPAGGFIDVR